MIINALTQNLTFLSTLSLRRATEEAVAIIQERQQKLYSQLIETEVIRSEIEQAISSIPAGLMQDILLERYIVGTPYWWMIANNLHISEKWARENHRKAIDALKI